MPTTNKYIFLFTILLSVLFLISPMLYGQASQLTPIGSTIAATNTDDGFTEVSLTDVFPFGIQFGASTYTIMSIGTNGYVTFGHNNTGYNPLGIAGYSLGPIIAGQYDDLHPGNGGDIYYYQNTAENYVVATFDAVRPYNEPTGYGTGSNGTSFQIVLRKPGDYSAENRNFQIEIRYINIGWHRAAIISPAWATAGWSFGDQATYGELPYSGTENFHLHQVESNIGDAGVYRWNVNLGVVQSSVSYGGNGHTGGSVPVDNNSPYETGATVTVLSPGTLVRAGYSFINWNTQSNGGGSSYNPGDTFSMPGSDVVLYAQWSSTPQYTLTYNAGSNGSISGTSPQTVTQGGNGTAVSAVPDAGYHFHQWSDGNTSNPRTDLNVQGNITVTAEFRLTVTQWPTATGITYGDPLSNSTLSGGTANVTGEFTFNSPAFIPGPGNYAAGVTFTPDDGGQYDPVSGTVTVSVQQKELTVSGTFTAEDKRYDGNANAVIDVNNLTLDGIVGGDAVSLTNITVVFDQTVPGTNIQVTITGADLTGAEAGRYTLSLSGAPSTAATILPVPDAGNAGTKLEVLINNVIADGSSTAEVRVTLLDEFDNPVPGEPVTFNVISGEAVLANATGITDSNGRYTSSLTNTKAQRVTITAVFGDANIDVINGSPLEVTFLTGTASVISKMGGDGQTAMVSETIENPLLVRVTDVNGNSVKGIPIIFEITEAPEGSAGEELINASTETDIVGWASAGVRLGTRAGTYIVTVTAGNAEGVSFTLTADIDPPGIPAGLTPEDGSENLPVDILFTWEEPQWGETYTLQISDEPEFLSPAIDRTGIEVCEILVGGLAFNTTYFWRVRAENTAGIGEWSDIHSLSTITDAPQVPVLLTPTDGAGNVPPVVLLTWGDTEWAETYTIQISEDPDFTILLIDSTGFEDPEFSTPVLTGGTVYYWRVRAHNEGGASGWSDKISFTTAPDLPGVPVLTLPESGTTHSSPVVALEWESVSGAESYRVLVALDPDFLDIIKDAEVITENLFIAEDLANLTLYYWRVSARNAGGESGWSEAWEFTVAQPPSDPPVLTFADGTDSVLPSTILTWEVADTVEQYIIQISADPEFGLVVIDSLVTGIDRFELPELEWSTTYYWRVCAVNTAGESEWSVVHSFTTAVKKPAVTLLASPADGTEHLPTEIPLTWEAADGAETYQLQIAVDPEFTETFANIEGLTELTFGSEGLEATTTYYWRVRGVNAGGEAEWSDVWSFTTGSVTGIRGIAGLPAVYSLNQNYPNPFNPSTIIRFGLPERSFVSLTVFNSLGQTVEHLVNDELDAGYYEYSFNASNLPTGIYIYRLMTDGYSMTKKMLFIK